MRNLSLFTIYAEEVCSFRKLSRLRQNALQYLKSKLTMLIRNEYPACLGISVHIKDLDVIFCFLVFLEIVGEIVESLCMMSKKMLQISHTMTKPSCWQRFRFL
jgi:hypothetical protein